MRWDEIAKEVSLGERRRGPRTELWGASKVSRLRHEEEAAKEAEKAWPVK